MFSSTLVRLTNIYKQQKKLLVGIIQVWVLAGREQHQEKGAEDWRMEASVELHQYPTGSYLGKGKWIARKELRSGGIGGSGENKE